MECHAFEMVAIVCQFIDVLDGHTGHTVRKPAAGVFWLPDTVRAGCEECNRRKQRTFAVVRFGYFFRPSHWSAPVIEVGVVC
jgi:hypothetical protein